jgi:transposase-like protein
MVKQKQMENIIEINGITLQKCPSCKEHLGEEHYYPSNWGKNGFKCKSCAKKYYTSDHGRAILTRSQRKWVAKNREKVAENARNWRINNPEKYNKGIYRWNEKNVDSVVANQKRYQEKMPPGVYAIKYKGEAIYVGATKAPIRRINTHMSTITTSSNITKINKLHSYLGYDKKDFTWEIIEECDVDMLFEKERCYQKELRSKENFKKHFGKVETTKSLVERLGLTTKPRNRWR